MGFLGVIEFICIIIAIKYGVSFTIKTIACFSKSDVGSVKVYEFWLFALGVTGWLTINYP